MASIAIMRRIVTQASVSIMVRSNILQKIFNLRVEKKRRLASQKKEKKKQNS